MSEIGEAYRVLRDQERQARQERLERNARQYNKANWRVHTDHHWSRFVDGKILDFWPSRDKWQYDKKQVRVGGLPEWLQKRGEEL